MTTSQSDKAARFRALHEGPRAFVIANPWDAGSARVLAALGFQALATSSGAKAGVLGKRDGKVTRDESLANARMIVEATDLPVSADLEKCFGDAPAVVAETIRLAAGVGLVGGSVEDATGEKDRPLYDIGQATERVAAAAQAARALPFPFMLTARTESFLRGNPNLDDVITRLQAFEKAGADVLMAPGLPDLAAVRAVCVAVIEARQFHGGHQGQVLHRRRARGGRRAPHQPGHVTLPLRDDEPRRGRARGEGQGDVRLHRPLDPEPRPRRVHAGLSASDSSRTAGCYGHGDSCHQGSPSRSVGGRTSLRFTERVGRPFGEGHDGSSPIASGPGGHLRLRRRDPAHDDSLRRFDYRPSPPCPPNLCRRRLSRTGR